MLVVNPDIRLEGAHHVADPDIWLRRGQLNMFPSIYHLFLHCRRGQNLEPNWMGGHGWIFPPPGIRHWQLTTFYKRQYTGVNSYGQINSLALSSRSKFMGCSHNKEDFNRQLVRTTQRKCPASWKCQNGNGSSNCSS